MKIKPSSANTKKSIISDKQFISKKPTIVKCFICNQMFYCQQSFDIHMDQHQKKVNKNLPQQIQRKTLQSFGLKGKQSINKKSTTLQSINQNEISDKKKLNNTLKYPIVYGQKLQNPLNKTLKETKLIEMNKKKSNKLSQIQKGSEQGTQTQQKKQGFDRQIQQIDRAIQQSSLLMSQIAFITQRYQHSKEIDHLDNAESESESQQQIQIKSIEQGQFMKEVRQKNVTIKRVEEMLVKTKFENNKSLQNCQIQVQCLRRMSTYCTGKSQQQKISKIKSKIVSQVINLIMANEGSKFAEKNHQIKTQNLIIQKVSQIKQEQNLKPRICTICLDCISFGQLCLVQGDTSYHKDCFYETIK